MLQSCLNMFIKFFSLKSQQGLLVDFTSFPKKFIDLLELCIAEQSNVVPR